MARYRFTIEACDVAGRNVTMTTSQDRIRGFYSGMASLYVPSVIDEAASLLDALIATAEKFGHDRGSEALGWLVTAAAEATNSKYGRPAVDRTPAETDALSTALADAFTAEGLKIAPCRIRMGVAVEPLPDGPTWGLARTGLAVALYLDSGWELMVNQEGTRVYSIHAPATADGAREVAALIHAVLRGEIADPFKRGR